MPAAGASDGCGCTGVTSSCRSEWPWLQRGTTRSTRVHAGYAAPRSQRTGVRVARSFKGQNTPHPWERPAPLLEVRPQGLLERHTGVGFELELDPVVPQMAEQLVQVVAPAPAVFQASSPVVEYIAPALAVVQAPSPVVEHFVLAPAVIPSRAPVDENISPASAFFFFFLHQRSLRSLFRPRQQCPNRQRQWWSISHLRQLCPQLIVDMRRRYPESRFCFAWGWTVGGCQPAGRGHCGPPSTRSARAWNSRYRRSASSLVSSLVCPSRPQTLQTRSGLWMATSWWLRRCSRRRRWRRTTMMTTTRSM